MSWPFRFKDFCGTFHPAFLLSIVSAGPLESVADILFGLIDQLAQFGLQEWLVMLPFCGPTGPSCLPPSRRRREACDRTCT